MTLTTPPPPLILSHEHERDPYETYRILREHHPVHYDESTDIWLVSRMDDLRALFKRKDVTSENYKFQIGQFHGRTLIEMEGKEHTPIAGCSARSSTAPGSSGFAPRIRTAASVDPHAGRPARGRQGVQGPRRSRRAAGEVAAGAPQFELVSEFTSVYPITVTREMLGVPDEMHETIVRWYQNIADAISNLEGAQEP